MHLTSLCTVVNIWKSGCSRSYWRSDLLCLGTIHVNSNMNGRKKVAHDFPSGKISTLRILTPLNAAPWAIWMSSERLFHSLKRACRSSESSSLTLYVSSTWLKSKTGLKGSKWPRKWRRKGLRSGPRLSEKSSWIIITEEEGQLKWDKRITLGSIGCSSIGHRTCI